MTRALFGLIGGVVALLPERMTRAYEVVAFENPKVAAPKRGLVSLVRAEGVIFVLAAIAGGRMYDRLSDLTGIFGALALCFPQRYLETGAALVYKNPNELEWRDGFVTAARVIGAVFLVLSTRACLERRSKSD